MKCPHCGKDIDELETDSYHTLRKAQDVILELSEMICELRDFDVRMKKALGLIILSSSEGGVSDV